ncbi:MAG: EAL domain-containing protein [Methylomonas sp.]|jgi:diguanylate cyclase (GGDEF)-like protein/PAS domain S-box-containing protein
MASINLPALNLDFNLLFGGSNTAIAISSLPDGVFVEANAAFLKLHGFRREEVIGHTSEELKLWNRPEEREQLLALLAKQGHAHNFAHEYRRKSGQVGYALASANIVDMNCRPHLIGFLNDISKLEEAQQAFVESDRSYQTLFNNMLNGFAHCRMLFRNGRPDDFIYLKVNKAFETHTGLKNVIGKKVSEVIPGLRESDPGLLDIYGRVALGGPPEQFEVYVEALQDWFSISVYSPEPEQFVAVFDVITKRKRAEEKLRHNEHQLRFITDHAPIFIAYLDNEKRYKFVNQRYADLFGVQAAEIVGKHPRQIIGEEAYARALPFMDMVLSGKETEYDQTLPATPRHGPLVVSVRYLPERNADGRIVGFIAAISDITERKQVEQQLRIAATAFESQEGMIITDRNSIILQVNKAFTKISGYSAADVIGKTPSLLSSGLHDAAFFADMWATVNKMGEWQGEIWNRRKSGEVYLEMLTITAVKNEQGEISHYVGALNDVTERKFSEDKIKQLAYYDQLTQLPNRSLLQDRLKQAFASSARSGAHGALLFIDLDNFKMLNDTLGHDIGDQLLQQVGQRLLGCIREGDTVSRIGGDEFVILLENLSHTFREAAAQSQSIGEKILSTLYAPYSLSGHEYIGTPSIGFSLFKGHGVTVDGLLKQADIAMYAAKSAGRNTMRFFDQNMQNVVTRRVALENDLHEAVQKNQFLLYYQAQVDSAGRVTGAEALIRWMHPERGMVSPAEFIPLAEEIGLILPIGHWVLETACRQLVAWSTAPATRDLQLAVNVSAYQFRLEDFVKQVRELFNRTGADPSKLKLELTESLLVVNVEDVIRKMSALKALGVSFSLDDFGTGYSSLSYLKKLPLSQLKIDQSFVRDLLTDSNDAAIARTIVALAQSMGLNVIAEGVETMEQRDFLAEHGCRNFQGYLFGKPVPIEQFQPAPLQN